MKQFKGKWLPQQRVGNDFLQECSNIVNDDALFSNFKQNNKFHAVIGNDRLRKNISDVLYKNIENVDDIIRNIEKYKTNDIHGNPVLYDYPKTGKISPGTLYFLNILQSLKKYFNDINDFNIVEIGGGYGGQAKIILDYGVTSYHVIDVPPALQLCKKYLSKYDYNNIFYYEDNNIPLNSYDLVISNWALSEFDEEGISSYVENVVQHCDRGYFLMNIWDHRKDFILSLLKKIFSVVDVYQEHPKTHKNNNWVLVVKK